MTPEIRAQIDSDMATAAAMPFREMVGYLAGYSARFDDDIRRGDVLREAIRAYADDALDQARAANQ